MTQPERSSIPPTAQAAFSPEYVFGESLPAPAETLAVGPGVHWLRMPLPFALDHINLWLLETGTI